MTLVLNLKPELLERLARCLGTKVTRLKGLVFAWPFCI